MIEEIRTKLRLLYFGSEAHSRYFRLFLLAIDVLLLGFFAVGSFYYQAPWHKTVDVVIAVVLACDWLARLWLYDRKRRYFRQVATWTDVAVIASLVLPVFAENYLFLRVLRFMRLFHSYHVLRDLRAEFRLFERHQEVIEAALNLLIFVFVMSAIVYVLQVRINPGINNYVDALYFTVATLTTTGFGDIIMRDTSGRLLAVFIMLVGFSLFFRLAQAVFQPTSRRHECPDCGLNRHDHDAVHCKHCGRVIKIETEGAAK